MSNAEEQRARKLAREEQGRQADLRKRDQRIDRAAEDLPEFGIDLSRDEIGAWLDFAMKLRELEAKKGPANHHPLTARLWDEGWVLAIAMLYRMNPDQDLTKPPKSSLTGPSFHRFAKQRRGTLYLAYKYAAEAMGATMSIEGERIVQENLDEAFPALDAFVVDEWPDTLRFDDEAVYQVGHDDYKLFQGMLGALSGLGEALRSKAWRDEVTAMCDQLSDSWLKIHDDLQGLSFPCDEPDEGMFVAGVYLNGLDHCFSLEQGHFAYSMQILNLLRGQGTDVSSLTGSLVGAFTSMTGMLDLFVDADFTDAESPAHA
ncbi:hypothetical protein [Dietzia cercidiphylli]|uniref:Uncharacterized protein n=1 Tax=Dietzia cercidiphylli TaxID=498199 RepID=A0ABP4U8L6_9ACTN|nr:hypothetical protein [Dietzia cercidiphylli]MBB1049515.1 hypothetical protein [Dietzia cercidiphylli]